MAIFTKKDKIYISKEDFDDYNIQPGDNLLEVDTHNKSHNQLADNCDILRETVTNLFDSTGIKVVGGLEYYTTPNYISNYVIDDGDNIKAALTKLDQRLWNIYIMTVTLSPSGTIPGYFYPPDVWPITPPLDPDDYSGNGETGIIEPELPDNPDSGPAVPIYLPNTIVTMFPHTDTSVLGQTPVITEWSTNGSDSMVAQWVIGDTAINYRTATSPDSTIWSSAINNTDFTSVDTLDTSGRCHIQSVGASFTVYGSYWTILAIHRGTSPYRSGKKSYLLRYQTDSGFSYTKLDSDPATLTDDRKILTGYACRPIIDTIGVTRSAFYCIANYGEGSPDFISLRRTYVGSDGKTPNMTDGTLQVLTGANVANYFSRNRTTCFMYYGFGPYSKTQEAFYFVYWDYTNNVTKYAANPHPWIVETNNWQLDWSYDNVYTGYSWLCNKDAYYHPSVDSDDDPLSAYANTPASLLGNTTSISLNNNVTILVGRLYGFTSQLTNTSGDHTSNIFARILLSNDSGITWNSYDFPLMYKDAAPEQFTTYSEINIDDSSYTPQYFMNIQFVQVGTSTYGVIYHPYERKFYYVGPIL